MLVTKKVKQKAKNNCFFQKKKNPKSRQEKLIDCHKKIITRLRKESKFFCVVKKQECRNLQKSNCQWDEIVCLLSFLKMLAHF